MQQTRPHLGRVRLRRVRRGRLRPANRRLARLDFEEGRPGHGPAAHRALATRTGRKRSFTGEFDPSQRRRISIHRDPADRAPRPRVHRPVDRDCRLGRLVQQPAPPRLPRDAHPDRVRDAAQRGPHPRARTHKAAAENPGPFTYSWVEPKGPRDCEPHILVCEKPVTAPRRRNQTCRRTLSQPTRLRDDPMSPIRAAAPEFGPRSTIRGQEQAAPVALGSILSPASIEGWVRSNHLLDGRAGQSSRGC